MYPSSPHDKQSLIDARLFISEQVDKYIAESLGPSTTTQEPEIPSTTTQKPEIQSTTTQKPEIQSTTTKESETSSGTTQKPGKSTTSSAPPLSSFINSLQENTRVSLFDTSDSLRTTRTTNGLIFNIHCAFHCSFELFLLVTLLVSIESIIGLPTNLPRVIFGKPLGGFLNNPFRKRADNKTRLTVEDVKTGTVTQKLDNFNPSDKRTWQQHYQYNPKFYNGSGLIFLLVGGESKIDVEWIADYSRPYMLWAKKHGAAVFQVVMSGHCKLKARTAHCADMYPSSPHDKQSLIDARLFIGEQVDKYIAECESPHILYPYIK
ncbi:unnamed protein product [Anisakis simplex]|uniref:Putative serine protease (inferred by orthology to a C. elegans protein) n=1 Tax=Anisakis simplex TaxID=6269 RepID=A0A0M3KC28_ANISI|nr:unnamed protein product [Anisakis simplex]